MTNEQAVKRAMALQALAGSANPHEAAWAAQKLASLLDEYDIEIGDSAVVAEGVQSAESSAGARLEVWQEILVNAVRYFLGCDAARTRQGGKVVIHWYAVGQGRANAASAIWARLVVVGLMGWAEDKKGLLRSERSRGNYLKAYAFALQHKASAIAARRAEDVQNAGNLTGTARGEAASMALVRADALQSYMMSLGFSAKDDKTLTIKSNADDAYIAGRALGVRTEIEPPTRELTGGLS